MKRSFSMFILLLFGVSVLMTACAGATDTVEQKPGDGSLQIVTTTGFVADAVKVVGGEHVSVQPLMGPGVDPHVYKATQSDISLLTKADMIFYHGLHLEGKMIDILEKMSADRPVHAIAEAIAPERLIAISAGGAHVTYDPHVWFDPQLWAAVVGHLAEQLSAEAPQHKSVFLANAAAYRQQLMELDGYARAQLAAIPAQKRVLVTAHDAFSYFGKAYGIEVVALQGISTDSEYSLSDVQRLVDLLVERNVRTVFTETSVSDRALNAVLKGAEARGHAVAFGQSLYSDALAGEGEAATYIGMFRHNLDAVVAGLK
jgi:manganese/zinc/iron transport system substrate-binding protein